MQEKQIKINSTPKNLRVLDYQESQNVFGSFSNQDIDNYYKTIVNKSEMRGIELEPQIREMEINHKTLETLKYQLDKFASVFYLFKDIWDSYNLLSNPQSMSTPKYIETVPLPKDEYLFVFNDTPPTEENHGFSVDNYTDFVALYSYPRNILKVHDNLMRGSVAKSINIELLKANGFIRDGEGENDGLYERLLQYALDGTLHNSYFEKAAECYKVYMTVKRKVDARDYADRKFQPYESEYAILKDLYIEGQTFGRENFAIDRIFITKSGIYIASLLNYGQQGQTIEVTPDDTWHIKDDKTEQIIGTIPSPSEELSLNCIAIKQILRKTYGDKADDIFVFPITVVCNDAVHINNMSSNTIVRGDNLYMTLEQYRNIYSSDDIQSFVEDIMRYHTHKETIISPIYTLDLEAVNTVYEDLYYNHYQYYLPKYAGLLWRTKRSDFYNVNISQKTQSSRYAILAGAASFLFGVYNTLSLHIGGDSLLSTTFLFLLGFTFLHLARYEIKLKNSWKMGRDGKGCYEVKIRAADGGYVALSALISLALSYILERFI